MTRALPNFKVTKASASSLAVLTSEVANMKLSVFGSIYDENTKKIIITLPDAVIQDVSVDMGTLDFIFEDSDYEIVLKRLLILIL